MAESKQTNIHKKHRLTEQQAQTFAMDWIKSWNSHDLDRILTHYSDNFEITTPMIKTFLGIDTGTLQGKQNIKEYWLQL